MKRIVAPKLCSRKNSSCVRASKQMAEYQAELLVMREKTARLRALRLARDAANQSTNRKGVAAARACKHQRGSA